MVPVVTLGLPADYAIDGWGRRIMYAVDPRFTAPSALTPYTTLAGPMTGNTAGTNTVSSIASTSGLSVGMGVVGSGIPPGTTITGVAASSITLSTVALTTVPNNILAFYKSGIGSPIITVADATTRMTVNDASSNPKTTKAAYVLISFGPNGHGAFPRGGSLGANLGSRYVAHHRRVEQSGWSRKSCHCSNSAVAQTFDGIFVQKTATQDSTHPDHTYDFDDVVACFATRFQS